MTVVVVVVVVGEKPLETQCCEQAECEDIERTHVIVVAALTHHSSRATRRSAVLIAFACRAPRRCRGL